MTIDPAVLERLKNAEPAAGGRFAVHSPLDGGKLADVADCGAAEARDAVERAAAVFPAWKKTTAYERSGLMRRWLSLLQAHEAAMARLMTLEMGKPITEAVGELRYSASFVEWYAEEAKRISGETFPSQFHDKRLLAIRQPAGIVYAISAWNFPHAVVTRKVAPALAAGCVVILKPAEQTPLSALYLASLWREAGGLPDVFQVLPAHDPIPVSQPILEDSRVRVLAFTGSTAVGKRLYAQCGPMVKRLALELGGHAPFLIFRDADLDAAVREVMASKFRNGGQTCVCANRIYVQEEIAAEFTARLTQAVAALRVGDPLDAATQIGPLVNRQAVEKVEAHVADAVGGGAKVLLGGHAKHGLYYEPTVLADVQAGMLVAREETFGPVAPVMTFRGEEDAIAQANATTYGLAAYLWTHDLGRAIRVSEALEFGTVGINDGVPSTAQAPLGGIKDSGLGREGGHWGIDEFLDWKYLSIRL